MNEFDTLAFFSDESLIVDPYKYYAEKRSQCPVQFDSRQGILAITGYDEAVSVYRDAGSFSACNSVIGPMLGLPFEPTGDDITDQIRAHRAAMPFSDFMSTLDPPEHTNVRGLFSKLMTPRRLKENEAFMQELADRQLEEFLESGKCEFNGQFAQPVSLLVIADLLGVPQEDHDAFRQKMERSHSQMAETQEIGQNPLQFFEERFTGYIESRRRDPRDDTLTALAQAKYPDGSTPEMMDIVRLATFLFAAGQETTGKLLTFALQTLGERPELQQRLRDEPSMIPNFLEECLRMEAPIKSHFRLTSKTRMIGDVPTKAGTMVMLPIGAFNRDPGHFENPDEFDMDRPNVREHLTFGRGIHTCPGAPLARVEGRVSLERILSRMTDIRISEAHHGPANARRYTYDPSFLLRGLTELHIEFSPAR